MSRITITNLKSLAELINKTTNSPTEKHTKNAEGKRLISNIGHYYINQAYGGYCLYRIINIHGGVSEPLNCGHIPAKTLYDMIHSYMRG
jgi:hypothetical protein